MINQKIRYSFVDKFLKKEISDDPVCEVGAGNYGLGRFYPHKMFFGIDVSFSDYSKKVRQFPEKMTPVTADITQKLPFPANIFPIVISLDTFEHIPFNKRERSIKEMIRISNNLIIVGFPCGNKAYRADYLQYKLLQVLKRTIPIWLDEHIKGTYPKNSELDRILKKLNVKYQVAWNESISLHIFIQFFEMLTLGTSFFDNFFSMNILKNISGIGKVFYRKFYIIKK